MNGSRDSEYEFLRQNADIDMSPGEHHSPDRQGITVLVVDDEKGVLDFAAMVLQLAGYEVLKAQSPSEAIKIVNDHNGAISAVVTDVVMPEMTGYDLSKYLRSRWPELKVMYISGYADHEVTKEIAADKKSILLPKPFTSQLLRQSVSVLLNLEEPHMVVEQT